MSVMAERFAHVAGASTILDVETHGGHLYRIVTGRDDNPPVGVRLMFALVAAMAELTLDDERLLYVAQVASKALSDHSSSFDALVAHGEVIEDVRQAGEFLFDASRTLHAMAQAARISRHEAEALLAFGHGVIEGPLRRYLDGGVEGTTHRRRCPYLLRLLELSEPLAAEKAGVA